MIISKYTALKKKDIKEDILGDLNMRRIVNDCDCICHESIYDDGKRCPLCEDRH